MTDARYHHGDLRPTLLREAAVMLRDHGLEGLSLRKLAERAGVTAPALYHHFRDKNDLLCALAEQGFVALEARTADATSSRVRSDRERMRGFVRAYVGFAADQPETYDLMFGRTIWKAGAPTESLRVVAYAAFRRYLDQAVPGSPPVRAVAETASRRRALRAAQVSWATLHGLCRLLIDGIYVDRDDVDAMCDEAAATLMAARDRAEVRT